MPRLAGLLAFLALAAVVAVRADPAPLTVVTTAPDLKALVEEVGGEWVRVESLTTGLQDPHALEVKPSHIAHLRKADLLARIGLDHEPWLGRLLQSAQNPRLAPGGPGHLDASRGITLLETATAKVGGGGHVHGFGNTHYWLDPENARPITAAIVEALARAAPAGRQIFEANRRRFLERLDAALAGWLKALAPYRGTRAVAYHNTWPYFARRFGLTVVAFIEPKPEVPPSPAYLASLLERMQATRVKVVLAEPYVNQAVARQVADRAGATLITLVPSVGGDPRARDYLALFDLNVERLLAGFRAAGLAPR